MAKEKIGLPKFGLPSKAEAVLLFFAGVTLFYLDVSQNKALDLGINYQTTYFGNIKSFALWNFYIGLFVYFVLLVIIIMLAVRNRHTHWRWDILNGSLAILGIAFLVGGFLSELAKLSNPAFAVPFVYPDWLLSPTTFYHLGVVISLITGLFFTFTE